MKPCNGPGNALPTTLLCAAAWLCAAPALACKCMPQSAADSLAQAVAVFEGEVVELREPGPEKTGPAAQRAVKLAVVRAWKGVEGEAVDVLTPSDGAACGYTFVQGRSYLVYASADSDGLRVVSCSRTRPISEANEDLVLLGMGATPVDPRAPSAVPEPDSPKSPPARGGCASCAVQGGPPVGAGGLLFATVAIGLGLRLRRARNRAPRRRG
jgi:hypothetical protein